MIIIHNNIVLSNNEKNELQKKLKNKVIYANKADIKSEYYEDEEFAVSQENLQNAIYSL